MGLPDDFDATVPLEGLPPGAASLPPAPALLAGRYELRGLLGEGGMGAVYRAFDRELGETVALKMLRSEAGCAQALVERFREEVRLARRVTHPNVARMFDIGTDGDARFLTMELVEGEALGAILEREGPLPLARVVLIVGQACAGLAAAHEAGIVHLDLKPDNVLVREDGRVVVADFGIARALAAREATRGFAGTPAYAAPEQVEGAPDVDARADVYALGVVIFECITGALPFEGRTSLEMALARLRVPPRDPRALAPDLPAAAAEVILRCMARDPAARFARVADVADALSSAVTASVRPAPQRPSGRHTQFDRTVAVLPVVNLGPEDDRYLADALTEDLTDLLSAMRGIRVRPLGSAQRALGRDRDARAAGKALGVQVVVDGTLRRVGPLVRVTLRLVSVEDGFQLWAMRSERPAEAFFGFGDEAAAALAEALASEDSPAPREGVVPPEAMDLYLRGRHLFLHGWIGCINEACDRLAQAHALAPASARIAACYGRALVRKYAFEDRSAGAKAQALLEPIADDDEARLGLAVLHLQRGEVVSGASLLARCLASSPSLAEALDWKGRLLVEVGPLEQGLDTMRRALALEPLLGHVPRTLARGRAYEGDWEGAVADLLATTLTEDDAPMHWMDALRMSVWFGDRDRAALFAERFAALTTTTARLRTIFASMHAALTERSVVAADRDLRSVSHVPRSCAYFAQLRTEVHGAIGDVDGAVASLAEGDAFGLVDTVWLDRCPVLADVRAAPAAARIVERIRARAALVRDELGA